MWPREVWGLWLKTKDNWHWCIQHKLKQRKSVGRSWQYKGGTKQKGVLLPTLPWRGADIHYSIVNPLYRILFRILFSHFAVISLEWDFILTWGSESCGPMLTRNNGLYWPEKQWPPEYIVYCFALIEPGLDFYLLLSAFLKAASVGLLLFVFILFYPELCISKEGPHHRHHGRRSAPMRRLEPPLL